MTEPWEDYAQQSGPWEDYAPTPPQTAQQPRPLGDKLQNFLRNVYNNPPPSIAALGESIKNARQTSMDVAKGEASPGQVAGLVGAAGIGLPISPASRLGALPAARVPLPERPTAPASPSMAELGSAATAQYQNPHVLDAKISPGFMHDTYNDVLKNVAQDYEPSQAPGTYSILHDALRGFRPTEASAPEGSLEATMQKVHGQYVPPRGPVTGQEVEAIRQRLGNLKATAAAPAERSAAMDARDALDAAMGQMPDEHMLAGNADLYRQTLQAARENTAAKYRQGALEGLEERADLAYNPGARALQAQSRNLLTPQIGKPPNYTRANRIGFNQPEQGMLRNLNAPSLGQRFIQGLGETAPIDPWRIAAHTAAGFGSGGASVGAIPLAFGARALSNRMAAGQLARAQNLVGQRSPLYQQRLANFQQQQAAYRAALSAQREMSAAKNILGQAPLGGVMGLSLQGQH